MRNKGILDKTNECITCIALLLLIIVGFSGKVAHPKKRLVMSCYPKLTKSSFLASSL